jgi:hypothetical protein
MIQTCFFLLTHLPLLSPTINLHTTTTIAKSTKHQSVPPTIAVTFVPTAHWSLGRQPSPSTGAQPQTATATEAHEKVRLRAMSTHTKMRRLRCCHGAVRSS